MRLRDLLRSNRTAFRSASAQSILDGVGKRSFPSRDGRSEGHIRTRAVCATIRLSIERDLGNVDRQDRVGESLDRRSEGRIRTRAPRASTPYHSAVDRAQSLASSIVKIESGDRLDRTGCAVENSLRPYLRLNFYKIASETIIIFAKLQQN